jgi:hypothetical protein
MSTSFVCILCGSANAETWGWVDLCHRGCFHNMRELLNAYIDGTAEVPDQRVVEYFTKNPETEHAFDTTKILAFIAANSEKKKE